jgi:EAL and modified HD-GYP domain-containing signal transduction protein
MSSIFVARQPIFELGRGLYGYELLYRNNAAIDHANRDTGFMSADVIINALLGIGLHTIADRGVAFVNFSREQLLNESWRLFERKSVVVEMLENVEIDAQTIAACTTLVQEGYTLALDDYVYTEQSRPLLEIASVIKVDILNRTREDLAQVADTLLPFKVRLLAERVETAAVRDMCADLGYELFQGYLFSRPETLTKTDVSAGQLAIMRLLNLIRDTRASDRSLESAFQTDLALTYKLLRIVNAAAIGGRGITSIPHAMRMIGRDALHRWLSVLLVASVGKRGSVNHELALTAMTRARMCEQLGTRSNRRVDGGSAFIVGLLSLLDVILEMPMDAILAKLELTDEVDEALLNRSGPYAPALQMVEAYERADWDTAQKLASENAIKQETLPELYVEALQWATQRVMGEESARRPGSLQGRPKSRRGRR